MMRKYFIFPALIFIVGYTGALAQSSLDKVLPMDTSVRYGKLPNGMTYYIIHNKKPENRVEFRLAVNAGSTAEGDHQQGLAHMLEHLCFNGTKNFKKSELVDYLESIGTKFGPHLNAYTSFDETVYMIQLPSDKQEIINKGLQILEDWAHNVSFDSVEIEKERGVVVEEWRLGQGAQERARRQYWPVLFKNSRYAERLPIGKKEVIDTCAHKAITDFYKAWYRPDLMAIAIVGDIDVEKMEQLVKKQFSSIKASRNAMPVKKWEVEDNAKLEVAIVKDKELTTSMVQLIYKQPATSLKTEGNYRTSICQSLISTILSARLSERSKEPEPPYLFARGGYSGLVRTQNAFMLMAAAPPNGSDKALETLVTEALRLKRHGILLSELERTKKSMMKDMEVSYNERDKRESRNLVSECVRNFLEGEAMPGIAAENNLYKKYMAGISKQELDSMVNVYITDGYNAVAILLLPDKGDVTIPEVADIETKIKSIATEEITPYMDMVTDAPLMEKIPEPISVLSEKRIDKFNITEWKLANGATVVLKPTEFKNDQLLINAQRLGGHSNCVDDEYRSALMAASLIDASGLGKMDANALEKYMMGHTANVSPFINEISEGFNGSTSPDDAELLFQMLHMYYIGIRDDENMFLSMINKQRATLQNKSASPESNFRDTISYVMSGYHLRSKPMTAERLTEISIDDAINFYKSRFAGVNGMVFTLVGNMDMASTKKLVEKYIATLPQGAVSQFKNINEQTPIGKIERTIYKGVEPKSQVYLKTFGTMEFNRTNRAEFNMLIKLVSIKLRESLREDKSGVYGVGVNGAPKKYPNQGYEIIVSFGCSPDNVEILIKAALDELEKIKKDGCSEKDLQKIKETALREREGDLKENNFWLAAISQSYINQEDITEIENYNLIVNAMNSEKLKQLANKYLSLENYARFVLMPEKK